ARASADGSRRIRWRSARARGSSPACGDAAARERRKDRSCGSDSRMRRALPVAMFAAMRPGMSTDISPEFAELVDGYRRFREGGWMANRERWEAAREGQQPQVMVIACGDSRVDPAQIFDTVP